MERFEIKLKGQTKQAFTKEFFSQLLKCDVLELTTDEDNRVILIERDSVLPHHDAIAISSTIYKYLEVDPDCSISSVEVNFIPEKAEQ